MAAAIMEMSADMDEKKKKKVAACCQEITENCW